MMNRNMLLTLLVLALFSPIAKSTALFEFHYQGSNDPFFGVLEGYVRGSLQADDNTVVVSEVVDFARVIELGIYEFPSLPIIGVSPGVGDTMTLDGSFFDFVAASDVDFTYGFSIGGGLSFRVEGYCDFCGYDHNFPPENWTMRLVPAPGTYALMLLGLVGLTYRGWKTRAVA
jgi:hypothetical protein